MVLHYRANMEFKLEMDPSLSGFALFSSVVRAKAPPALAPATLALLGLLGLTSAFRRRDDPPFGDSLAEKESAHVAPLRSSPSSRWPPSASRWAAAPPPPRRSARASSI